MMHAFNLLHPLRASARFSFALAGALLMAHTALAGIGDPQVRTDHAWYPGELSCSTFERLFATQAALYQRVTGKAVASDEDKALASWFWRNLHYWHAQEGFEDYWGRDTGQSHDRRSREYWTGLFAHGFGLCGTTHSQWTAEFEHLLGHGRARGVGVDGHNAFEAFLTGGAYGNGRWVLLDHDLSTVIYNDAGNALLSIKDILADWKRLTDRTYKPEKQNGWLVSGLHPNDGSVYRKYAVAEYLPGYAAVPPMVHLRRGETLRRYLQPGLEDGKTFVFWGRNYNTAGIPGPERSLTWVNQPEKMFRSRTGAGYQPGQARYGNAVYTYRPNFGNGDYREGVMREDARSVVFEFTSPFVIGATPPNSEPWGIYDAGGRNGLVLRGTATCAVALSLDHGRTWIDAGSLIDGMDLTDHVKGRRQYWIRFGARAPALAGSGLVMTTVCQANAALMPHLKNEGSVLTFQASNQAVFSAGPSRETARTHVVAGGFDTPAVTLEIAAPRGERPVKVHAAAHVASGNPPNPEIRYQIEFSTDSGQTWKPLVKDWNIPRRGDEPAGFWSQSLCFGSVAIDDAASSVQIRFRNNGGKKYLRAEAHLVYRLPAPDQTRVTFAWTDHSGDRRESNVFAAGSHPADWKIPTGRGVKTRWVEFEPLAR